MIQYETSEILVGDTNIAEAIETQDDILFSESYLIAGQVLKAHKIYANYNLTVAGDVEAKKIEVNGDFIVNGNIKAEEVRCKRLMCGGKIHIGSLQCDENVMAKQISGESINVQGSMIVSDVVNIEETCEVEGNIIAGEGISGEGYLKSQSTVVGDYFDFDGETETNIYEISTMFEKATSRTETKHDIDELDSRLDAYLSDFFKKVVPEEEDYILEEVAKCAKIQRISFEEMYYLLCEIMNRVSYLDEITNFRDYLLVKYTEDVFPEELKGYETIEHVYTDLIKDIDVDEMEYSSDDILQFTMSLKISATLFSDRLDEYAEKIFSSIGLKYDFVKQMFERD